MIAKEDMELLDARYVKQTDCVAIQTDTDKRIDAIHEAQAVMNVKMNVMIGIASTIAVPVIAIAVKLLFGVGG